MNRGQKKKYTAYFFIDMFYAQPHTYYLEKTNQILNIFYHSKFAYTHTHTHTHTQSSYIMFLSPWSNKIEQKKQGERDNRDRETITFHRRSLYVLAGS